MTFSTVISLETFSITTEKVGFLGARTGGGSSC
jgi:hypothetical protein